MRLSVPLMINCDRKETGFAPSSAIHSEHAKEGPEAEWDSQ